MQQHQGKRENSAKTGGIALIPDFKPKHHSDNTIMEELTSLYTELKGFLVENESTEFFQSMILENTDPNYVPTKDSKNLILSLRKIYEYFKTVYSVYISMDESNSHGKALTRAVKHKKSEDSDMEEGGNQDEYEHLLQQAEATIRKHIRTEQQLSLICESTKIRCEELEKAKNAMVDELENFKQENIKLEAVLKSKDSEIEILQKLLNEQRHQIQQYAAMSSQNSHRGENKRSNTTTANNNNMISNQNQNPSNQNQANNNHGNSSINNDRFLHKVETILQMPLEGAVKLREISREIFKDKLRSQISTHQSSLSMMNDPCISPTKPGQRLGGDDGSKTFRGPVKRTDDLVKADSVIIRTFGRSNSVKKGLAVPSSSSQHNILQTTVTNDSLANLYASSRKIQLANIPLRKVATSNKKMRSRHVSNELNNKYFVPQGANLTKRFDQESILFTEQ